jgi:hypothetical protein
MRHHLSIKLCASALALLIAAACTSHAGSDNGSTAGDTSKATTPTQLKASASNYDGQLVNVTGTAVRPRTRQTKRGTMTGYRLCDKQGTAACIHVMQFADSPSVADGTVVSVSGVFHASLGKKRKVADVLVVGLRNGKSYGGRLGAQPRRAQANSDNNAVH